MEEIDHQVTMPGASEVEPGLYHAITDFVNGGEAHVKIVLLDENGQEVGAEFHFSVADAH